MKNIKLKFISLYILLFALMGCMPDSLTKFQKDPPQKAPALTQAAAVAPPDLTTLQYFQVRNITQKSTSYHFHKYGAGNALTACEIPVSSIADGETLLEDDKNDILCWLEADEEQLFFNGVDFQINAPAGYCDYIEVKPYYYWNLPPVNTQKLTEEITCSKDTPAIPATLGTPAIAEIPAIPGVGGNPDTPAVPAVPAVPPTPAIPASCPQGLKSANKSCFGDYTFNNGPNCDEGYIVVQTTAYDDDGAPSITRSKPEGCGGKRTNCYMGPGIDFKVNKDGFPMSQDTLASNGESVNYSATSPGGLLGKGFYSNHYISNYTALFATGLNTYDYTTIASNTGLEKYSETSSTGGDPASVIPTVNSYTDRALDPLKTANSALVKNGTDTWTAAPGSPRTYAVNPFYEFSCLNYAREVKARVRVQIREWNQIFRLPVTADVEQSVPSRLIKQGRETSGVGFWNDLGNWDTPTNFGPLMITNDGLFQVGNFNIVPVDAYGFQFPFQRN